MNNETKAIPEPFITATAIAEHIGVSARTVAKWAREGRIPAHPVSGNDRRTWRFKLSEIELFFASQSDGPILPVRPGSSAEGR